MTDKKKEIIAKIEAGIKEFFCGETFSTVSPNDLVVAGKIKFEQGYISGSFEATKTAKKTVEVQLEVEFE